MGPPEGGADFWIMWRRVAGGLKLELQKRSFNRLRSVLAAGQGQERRQAAAQTSWPRCGVRPASLERLDVKQKEQLGQPLLKVVPPQPGRPARLLVADPPGARVLLYGPLNAVLHPQIVHDWLDAILSFEPGNDSERLAWAFCLAQLARRSGQRALDMDDSHRESVLTVLRGPKGPRALGADGRGGRELTGEEQSQMLGERCRLDYDC